MCISAPASFFAGTVLLTGGIITLKRAGGAKQSAFAAIPLVFAVQQFCEGFVWLSLQSPVFAHFKPSAVFIFLLFAQVIWPVYVPASVLLLESDPVRRKILKILLLLGAAFSLWLLYGISLYPVDARISASHILYEMHYPQYMALAGSITYFAATVLSLFIGSQPRLKILGFVILLSFIASKMYFADTLISVWCFFAAIASTLVYYVLRGMGGETVSAAKQDVS